VVQLRTSGSVTVLKCSAAACALTALVLAAVAGCGSGSQDQTPGTVSSMKVTAGQDFNISLQSNPTTGYQWQLDGPLDEKVVKYVSKEYKADQSGGTENVGAGGVEIWTFKAVGKGGADIKMKYVRPFEKGTKPAEQRVFKVTVD
jgi:inhibitor of cysteine peptidase